MPVAEQTARVEPVMGIPIGIDVRDDVDPRALDRAFAYLRWVDATFSTYVPDSELARVDAGADPSPPCVACSSAATS